MSWEDDASQAMGEPVSHAAVVSPKGQGKKLMAAGAMRQVAGVAGAIAGEKMAGKRPPSTPGGFEGGYMIMALGRQNVAFFEAKNGLLKKKLGKLLATHPRAEVTSMEMGGGTLTKEVTLELADGTNYPLEVPRANAGGVEKLIKALTGE